MKLTGKLQKEILENKILSIEKSIEDVKKKRILLQDEAKKLEISRNKILKTLEGYGKPNQSRTIEENSSKSQANMSRIGEINSGSQQSQRTTLHKSSSFSEDR
jgi:hypothetical protein